MPGCYVAYDAGGRDYAYALHPDRCEDQPDQQREVNRMRKQARARGGSVKLLSPDEFSELIAQKE